MMIGLTNLIDPIVKIQSKTNTSEVIPGERSGQEHIRYDNVQLIFYVFAWQHEEVPSR